MKYLDTNLILRYLINDPEAERVEKLLKSSDELFLPDVVFAEIVWVLKSFYKWEKSKILAVTTGLLKLNSIKANKNLLLNSIKLFENYNIKYVDAYIAASMYKNKTKLIYSFDRDFDKIDGIKRLEPK